jgi:hypothetical protein
MKQARHRAAVSIVFFLISLTVSLAGCASTQASDPFALPKDAAFTNAADMRDGYYYKESITYQNITLPDAAGAYSGKKYLVVNDSRDYFVGGAHGLRYELYHVYDVAENKELHLADLLKSGADVSLKELAIRALQEKYGTGDGAPLTSAHFLTDSPDLPDQFYFTEDGLGLHWGLYEIAPYVNGMQDVAIAWQDAAPLLK